MKMNYVVNKYKLVIAALCCVVFAAVTVLLFLWKARLLACIPLILCIVYCVVAIQNGSVVRVDAGGVSRRFPKRGLSMDWEEIGEVGVAGLRVLNSEGKRYTGTRYIYVSKNQCRRKSAFTCVLIGRPRMFCTSASAISGLPPFRRFGERKSSCSTPEIYSFDGQIKRSCHAKRFAAGSFFACNARNVTGSAELIRGKLNGGAVDCRCIRKTLS